MRYLILIFLLSCAQATPIKEVSKQKICTTMDKQIFLDGCYNGVLNAFLGMGVKLEQINSMALVELCVDLAEERLTGKES